jgi:hypothetical protein
MHKVNIPLKFIVIWSITTLVAVISLVMVIVLKTDLSRTQHKLGRFDDRLSDLRYSQSGSIVNKSSKTPGIDVEKLRSLELKLAAIQTRIASIENREDEPEKQIDELVDRKLGEKMLDVLGEGDDDRSSHMTMDEMGEKLSLSENQKMRVADTINRGRERILELASEAIDAYPEGAEEMKAIVHSKATSRKKMLQIAKKLQSNSPPDSDQSYYETIINLRSEAIQEIKSTLTAEQFAKFQKTGVGLVGIRTGYFKGKSN